jgi:hypothetical protein
MSQNRTYTIAELLKAEDPDEEMYDFTKGSKKLISQTHFPWHQGGVVNLFDEINYKEGSQPDARYP